MRSHGKVEIQAVLTNQGGRVVKRYPWRRANSLIKQFIQILMGQMSWVNTTNVMDTGGENRTVLCGYNNLDASAATDITTYGIVVGTGITAVTMTDNRLEAQVTGNIAHGAVTIVLENPDTNTWRIAITRVFTNNTGGTLSVKEAGLYVRDTIYSFFFCVDRTLYAVDVPSELTLTLTYRITISL